jgi:hypothetical protein
MARQGRLEADLTFEVIEAQRPVLFAFESSVQKVYLAGYEPGSIVMVHVYEDPLVVVFRDFFSDPETSLKYTGTMMVVTDQRGAAVLRFPPTRDPCTIYRLGSDPVARVTIRSVAAPRICV